MLHRRSVLAAWLAFVALAVAPPAPLFAQTNAAGEWRVNFVVPTGTRSVSMVINQQRATLSGTVINEDGEFPLKGRIADDQVTIVWTVPEAGKLMELTMKGKVSGDSITGTVQLGDVGEGPLSARRTAE
jgi:L-seryl-tRNA(Ser) seleniumtransferase